MKQRNDCKDMKDIKRDIDIVSKQIQNSTNIDSL